MIFVYVTMPNMEEAKIIAQHIIANRLAAGVNIFPEIHSIYHWQGKVENAKECVCIFKTKSDNFEALKSAIVQRHSYVTPCIVALPVTYALPAFVSWVQEESTNKE